VGNKAATKGEERVRNSAEEPMKLHLRMELYYTLESNKTNVFQIDKRHTACGIFADKREAV